MVTQCQKEGVTLKLNCRATAEMIQEAGFDVVIACTGAESNIPANIKGIYDEQGNRVPVILTLVESYQSKEIEDSIGQKVVVVGGSEAGVECGMHMCELGKEVIVTTRQDCIAYDASRLHSITMSWIEPDDMVPGNLFSGLRAAWQAYPNFSSIHGAAVTAVTPKSVTDTDAAGEHTIDCDTVIISGGMKPRIDEALSFSGCSQLYYRAGDCVSVGNIQKSNRQAFGAAIQF